MQGQGQMTFDELKSLVEAISYDARRMEVRFGCDCGCGGNSYSEESWDIMCEEADEAERKLKEIGITFDE